MAPLLPSDNSKDSPFRDAEAGVSISFTARKFKMCYVEESELDNLASIGELNVAFLGICIGALIAFLIVLTTTPIERPKVFATYVALEVVAALGTAYFAIKTGIDIKNKNRKVRALKGN